MSTAPNSKTRTEALQQAAESLLKEQGVDVTQQVVILPLAEMLKERTGCHITTAKHHVLRAAYRARGVLSAQQHGGARPGAGEPVGVEIDGVWYASIAAAARAIGVSRQVMWRRLRKEQQQHD